MSPTDETVLECAECGQTSEDVELHACDCCTRLVCLECLAEPADIDCPNTVCEDCMDAEGRVCGTCRHLYLCYSHQGRTDEGLCEHPECTDLGWDKVRSAQSTCDRYEERANAKHVVL